MISINTSSGNKPQIDHINNENIHVSKYLYSSTITTTWTGTSPPYTQDITVSGMLSTDVPVVDIVLTGTYSNDTNLQFEWNKIYRIVTGSNKITVYAEEKTTLPVNIQMKGTR